MSYNELKNFINEAISPNGVIPNPHERLRDVFNLRKAVFTLIGSNTGSGKTSYVDDTHVLRPYMWSLDKDIHFEVLYYSMERKKVFKLAKWLSWIIKYKTGKHVPYDRILGFNPDKRLNKKGYAFLDEFREDIDNLEKKITIYDGMKTVLQIETDIEQKAAELGDFFTSDNTNLYLNGKRVAEKKKFPLTFTFKDKKYIIKANDHIYVTKKKQTFLFIIVDHIGKVVTTGYPNKKAAIDDLDRVMSDARDKYSFSPILISQFNRSVSDYKRLKDNKGVLEPILEDFKDSSNTQESADLVLSLFDPYRYKSFDNDGRYRGYSLTDGMLTPSGIQRFRSLHILKNSYGLANITYGFKFLGEYQWFEVLPRATETQKLEKIYMEIAKGY